jgi:hypothetical protein
MRRFLAILIAAISTMAGCAMPQPPPPMSMAKFARPPAQRNRLGFSSGVAMHIDPDEDTSLYAFPVEGGLGASFGDRYDLGISFGPFLGTAEGNVALIDGDFRLGIIHGLGLGLIATDEDQSLVTQLTGGTFLQTGRRRAFFMGLKGTYGLTVGPSDTFEDAGIYTGTMGFLPSGRVKVIPELAVQNMRWEEASEPLSAWTVAIGVTVMIHYLAPVIGR